MIWYRTYSDKWLEQVGIATYPEYTTYYNSNINLVKSYQPSTYFAWSNLRSGDINWAMVQGANVSILTTTSFVLNEYISYAPITVTVKSHQRYWFAEGYASETCQVNYI